MPNVPSALAFIDEAIEALSIHMERAADRGDGEPLEWEKVCALESTIAVELERIDRALGPAGSSMFFPLAEAVKQAMAALHGARDALNSIEGADSR